MIGLIFVPWTTLLESWLGPKSDSTFGVDQETYSIQEALKGWVSRSELGHCCQIPLMSSGKFHASGFELLWRWVSVVWSQRVCWARGQLIQPSTFMLGSSYKQFMHDKLNMKVFLSLQCKSSSGSFRCVFPVKRKTSCQIDLITCLIVCCSGCLPLIQELKWIYIRFHSKMLS